MAKRDVWTPSTPWFGPDKNTKADWPRYVCRNPNCKSYGKSHPNCRCGIPSFAQQSKSLEYAHGGEVHFCHGLSSHHSECEHYAEGGQVEDQLQFETNPDLSVDHAVAHHGLLHLLTKTGKSRSEDPTRVFNDHLSSVRAGKKQIRSHGENVFSSHKEHEIHPSDSDIAALKDHLDHLEQNPHELIDAGGQMGNDLPDHATALGAKAATALDYFQAMRPQGQQAAPLDQITPPSKINESYYRRQLAIAQNPSLIYQGIREGVVRPGDLKTLDTLYPQLGQSMRSHAAEALITEKSKDAKLPYKQKKALSIFLGQPLDSTLSLSSMQAIIQANGSSIAPSQEKPGKRSHQGATAQTQKTIERTDKMYETPIEARQLNHRS